MVRVYLDSDIYVGMLIWFATIEVVCGKEFVSALGMKTSYEFLDAIGEYPRSCDIHE